MIQSRKPYYGEHTNPKAYFEGGTREFLKTHLKGMIDCEVSIELIKQRIYNKLRMNCDQAFKSLASNGIIRVEDIRNFLKSLNIFPMERELQLLFERFDKDEDGVIAYHEFVAGLSPFMNLSGQN